ncbi:MAG: hypothetical protein ACTHOE_04920 [Conexibacter sp.]
MALVEVVAAVAVVIAAVAFGVGVGIGWAEPHPSEAVATESETVAAMLRVAQAAFDAECMMHAEADRHADVEGSVVSLEERWSH